MNIVKVLHDAFRIIICTIGTPLCYLAYYKGIKTTLFLFTSESREKKGVLLSNSCATDSSQHRNLKQKTMSLLAIKRHQLFSRNVDIQITFRYTGNYWNPALFLYHPTVILFHWILIMKMI